MRETLIVALLLSGCGAHRQAALTPEPTGGIVVTGRAEVEAPPDRALVQLGVEVQRPTVGEAREEAARAQRRVLDALERSGVRQEDLRTTQLAVHPDYEHTPGGRHLRGYVVRNVVEARLSDLGRVQAAIDGALDAGGDLTRLDGLRFELTDPAPVRRRARAQAIEAARADAEQLARALGVELGEPLSVEDLGRADELPGPMMLRAEGARMGAATPIEPGSTRVAVEVRVRWAMSPG